MSVRQMRTPAIQAHGRYIDLSGDAIHIFNFAAPVELAYEYFCDVPAVFRLLPDALRCYTYGPDRYRLIVGATDGHGHDMAACFDLQAHHEPGNAIKLLATKDGPPLPRGGGSFYFHGALSAEAIFQPTPGGSTIEYVVSIDMSIPVPAVLNLMPTSFLQSFGERTMEYKMGHMVDGFTRGITNDFHAWAGVA